MQRSLLLKAKLLNDEVNDCVSRVERSCQSASIRSCIFIIAPFFRCSSAFNKFIEQVIAKMDGENCVRFHCRYLCPDECTKEVMEMVMTLMVVMVLVAVATTTMSTSNNTNDQKQ